MTANPDLSRCSVLFIITFFSLLRVRWKVYLMNSLLGEINRQIALLKEMKPTLILFSQMAMKMKAYRVIRQNAE